MPGKAFHRPVIKTPTVLQNDETESGAAALCSILAYYEKYVPLEEVLAASGAGRRGGDPEHLACAAVNYGLDARVAPLSVDELQSADLPLLAVMASGRFMVVNGFRDGVFMVGDTARGPRKMKEEEFRAAYREKVILLHPGERFEKGGENPTFLRGMLRRLEGTTSSWGYVFIASAMLLVPGLAVPVMVKEFVDQVLVRQLTSWVTPLLLGLLVSAFLQAWLTYTKEYFLARAYTRVAVRSSSEFGWHLLRLPMSFFTARSVGDISTRVGLSNEVASLLAQKIARALISGVMAVFYLAVMAWYDLSLTAVVVFLAALNFLCLKMISRARVVSNQRLLTYRGAVLTVSLAGLQCVETLKATAGEPDFFARWAGVMANTTNERQRLSFFTAVLSAVPTCLSSLTTVVILLMGGLRVISGEISLGTLLAFQSLAVQFAAPIESFVGFGARMQDAVGELLRLDDVLCNKVDPVFEEASAQGEDEPAFLGPKLEGDVELKDVTFGYDPTSPALVEGLCIQLKPGARVALVGASGSGKSTIGNLVAGLYRPWKGQVLLDGVPRQKVPRIIACNSVAKVDQSIHLFEGTIRDNLSMWDANLPLERLTQACKDACVDEIIVSRPGGYEGRVAEGGSNFSGGERQRLEIARALALDPSVLVLDEATSALDPRTEKFVDMNLRRRGCTCILIAHRLSTIRDCDEIIVLDNGKVVQRGVHEDLSRQEGPYLNLIKNE